MRISCCISLIVFLSLEAPGYSQTPWKFRWEKGQVFNYRTQHTTSVEETVEGTKSSTQSNLQMEKAWEVVNVDQQGIATLQLKLTSMVNQLKGSNGEVRLFDSKDNEKSTPEMRGMIKFINQPLALLRMDIQGRIVDVKMGQASKFEADPPFGLILPGVAPQVGQAWNRTYNITLEPPQGTGEKFPAQQRFTCTDIQGGKAVLTVATELKNLPDSPSEQIPLLEKDAQGQVIFDITSGMVSRIELNVDRMVENHQGKGSQYKYKSKFEEQLIQK